MIEIKIKPMSVNQAWKGRRFKSKKYIRYSQNVSMLLPAKIEIPDGKLQIFFRFYVSSKLSDYDNPIKPVQDIICDKYGINDNRFFKATIEKIEVAKHDEKIEFDIKAYD